MKNVMDIKGYKALIAFDPDTNLFRGEFVDLNAWLAEVVMQAAT